MNIGYKPPERHPAAARVTSRPGSSARAVIAEEQRQMRDHRLAKTANRSVIGIMNEFTFLAESYRSDTPAPGLLALAIRLAATPCGPLHRKQISPDRELAALLHSFAPPAS